MKIQSYMIVTFLFILNCNCYAIKKQNVVFSSENINLSGTIYFPKGDGPFPGVVFVHGSGMETRKNSAYSAKWLASIGYATLIFDKRGTGKSESNEKDVEFFSFEMLASDVLAAVKYLNKQSYIDNTKIGLHATSQGGWVAPLVATKTNLINFMIIKSASVTTVNEDRLFERTERLRIEGFSEDEILEAQEMQRVEAKKVQGHKTQDDFTILFEKYKLKNWFKRVYPFSNPFVDYLVEYRKWYNTIVDFDPIIHLENLDIPIVWIFGDFRLDKNAPVKKSIENLNQLIELGKEYTILEYEGEGHNINEKKYEIELFKWLQKINHYGNYKFKKH